MNYWSSKNANYWSKRRVAMSEECDPILKCAGLMCNTNNFALFCLAIAMALSTALIESLDPSTPTSILE
jgi:hypothetical protein